MKVPHADTYKFWGLDENQEVGLEEIKETRKNGCFWVEIGETGVRDGGLFFFFFFNCFTLLHDLHFLVYAT